jgi:hypothetical protein
MTSCQRIVHSLRLAAMISLSGKSMEFIFSSVTICPSAKSFGQSVMSGRPGLE